MRSQIKTVLSNMGRRMHAAIKDLNLLCDMPRTLSIFKHKMLISGSAADRSRLIYRFDFFPRVRVLCALDAFIHAVSSCTETHILGHEWVLWHAPPRLEGETNAPRFR